jgi:hypothetical protein
MRSGKMDEMIWSGGKGAERGRPAAVTGLRWNEMTRLVLTSKMFAAGASLFAIGECNSMESL